MVAESAALTDDWNIDCSNKRLMQSAAWIRIGLNPTELIKKSFFGTDESISLPNQHDQKNSRFIAAYLASLLFPIPETFYVNFI